MQPPASLLSAVFSHRLVSKHTTGRERLSGGLEPVSTTGLIGCRTILGGNIPDYYREVA
jgi:hypothetical protein